MPYEMAMERILEREEESAAPMVPEERANAADGGKRVKVFIQAGGYQTDQRCCVLDWDRISDERSRSDGEDETVERTRNKIDLARPKVMKCDVSTCGRCLNPVDEQGSGWRVAALVHHLIESTPPAKSSAA
jgi:hypothetical protein